MAFGMNGLLSRAFDKYTTMKSDSDIRGYLTGGITGFCTAFVLCPADILKCRAQLERAAGGTGNIRELMGKIIKKEGLRGFYTGLGCQIARDIPFYFFFFGSYELSCSQLKKNFPTMSDTAVYFISGGLAGQCAWLASMPMDAVKSIVQTQDTKISAVNVYKNIMAKQGFGGLYNGVGVAVIRAFPANAALFLGYELSRKLM